MWNVLFQTAEEIRKLKVQARVKVVKWMNFLAAAVCSFTFLYFLINHDALSGTSPSIYGRLCVCRYGASFGFVERSYIHTVLIYMLLLIYRERENKTTVQTCHG